MSSLVCFAAEHLLRTDPEDGLEGFFIALFVRKEVGGTSEEPSEDATVEVRTKRVPGRRNGVRAFSSLRLSRMILW